MKKVYDTINQYCVEHELLTNGDGIVIGLSGGMDSVCLLQVLAALRNEWHASCISVITTHQLPGDAVKDTVVKAQAMSQQQHRRIADEVKASKEKAPAAGKVEKMKKAPLEKTDQEIIIGI